MRNLLKNEEPEILRRNSQRWTELYLENQSHTNKYRYRVPEIKSALKKETSDKCVYCESKIGHNTPGDVEHKIPSSRRPELHFSWTNLTIACTECNRRKNNYYEEGSEFLDPYEDDVESLLHHCGPLVLWHTNNQRAEITLRTLELHDSSRLNLILKKIESINDFSHLIERYVNEENQNLKSLLWRQIQEKISVTSEYSGMLKSILRTKALIEY